MPDKSPQRPSASDTLALAVEQHRAGHLRQAAELYKDVLAADAKQAQVWHYLGSAERDRGEIGSALEAFRQAVEQAPENQAYRAELASALHATGRLEEAVAAYRVALDGDPADHICRNNLAGALSALGRATEAIEEYRRALEGATDSVEIYVNLGVTLQEAGRSAEAADILRSALRLGSPPARAYSALADACLNLGERGAAIDAYRNALAREPENATVNVSLGVALQREGRTDEAYAAYGEALRQDPKSALALTNLGALMVETNRLDEALTPLQQAVGIAPADAPARCNLGAALLRLGQVDEAQECLEAAVQMDGEYAAAWGNLGNVFQDKLRLEDVLGAHTRALSLEPENPELHWNRAMTLLLAGDLEAGFEEYEWRLKMPRIAARTLPSPVWQGEDPAGASILLVAEQGLGDTIQFARFAPALSKKGARVAIACARSLVTLFSTLDGVEHAAAADDPLPDHDYHLPLMSLPHRLGITSTTIPGDVPYLGVPSNVTAPPDHGKKRRIGITWCGNPEHPTDRQRSCGLGVLKPLFDRSDVEWVSLQFGSGVDAIDDEGLADVVADWSPFLDGFGDTAAAIEALDLVITIDSAAAHVAGALARPVWLMLKYAPDWRWTADGDTTPWYPTMRLFRQQQPGDWGDVVDRVSQGLDDLG